MRIKLRHAIITAVLFAVPVIAIAQAQGAPEKAQPGREQSAFDISASFYKTFSTSTSGNGTIQKPVDSYGGMVAARYAPSPWKGLEIGYSFNRLNQTYSIQSACGFECSNTPLTISNNQSQVTVAYVASRKMGKLTPFAEGGFAFVIAYGTGNGYAINTVVRPGYVAGAGADFGSPRLGLRVQFRQTSYKAPNLTATYFPTGKFTQTVTPMIGIYFRPW